HLVCPQVLLVSLRAGACAHFERVDLCGQRRGASMRNKLLLVMCLGALSLAACSEQDTVPAEQTFGPSPTLPPPEHSLLPAVNFATATGWPAGGKPRGGQRKAGKA